MYFCIIKSVFVFKSAILLSRIRSSSFSRRFSSARKSDVMEERRAALTGVVTKTWGKSKTRKFIRGPFTRQKYSVQTRGKSGLDYEDVYGSKPKKHGSVPI